MSSTKAEIIRNYGLCFDSVRSLLRGLGDERWAVQSFCPEWDVRGVVVHLLAVENALVDWPDMSEPFFAPIPPFLEANRTKSPAELLDVFDDVTTRRLASVEARAEPDYELPCWSPVGPVNYRRFMDVRVFDWWVHEQDIRGPLGIPGHTDGHAAEVAVDEVHVSMGYIVGKKIGFPDGKSLTVHLTGPVTRDIHAKVDGRATGVDSLDGPPDAEISLDSVTFVQLACGRIDPAEPIDAGQITFGGDLQLADQIARNLAFTM